MYYVLAYPESWGEAHRRGAPLAGTANSSPVETPSGSPATSCGRV